MEPVVIIGGGIIGTSVADQLSDRSVDVTVVEKDRLGTGTTGKSIACFAWHLNADDLDYGIANRAWRVYEPLIEKGLLSFHQNGFMKIADTEAFFDQLKDAVEDLRAMGITARIPSDEEIAACNVDPDAVGAGASYYPDVGRLDPGEIVPRFAERAVRNGATIETGVEVTDIHTENGAVVEVDTSTGTMDAGTVINAAGPWAPAVNDMVGVSLPLKHTLAPILVLDTAENFWLPTVIFESGVYFTGEQSAKTLGGYGPHESGDADQWAAALDPANADARQGRGIGTVSEDHRAMIVDTALDAIPPLSNADISSGWQGVRCITPDHTPVVGETAVEDFYVITGMSGEGITLGPGCAGILADYLMTGEPTAELEYLAPYRFRS